MTSQRSRIIICGQDYELAGGVKHHLQRLMASISTQIVITRAISIKDWSTTGEKRGEKIRSL